MLFYEGQEYTANKDWPYSLSAGCVVYSIQNRDIRILLLERYEEDKTTYHLPKGRLAFDETLQQTALRETKEESGCEAEIQTYLGAMQREYIKDGINLSRSIHYFASKLVHEEAEMDDEHDGKSWVSIEEAAELLAMGNPKEEYQIIPRFKNFINQAGINAD